MDGNVKLAMEKFELLKAMHTLVKAMNDENAYLTWINVIPDGADDAELIEIAADDDEEIYRDACNTFRRICNAYARYGFYLGGYGRPCGLYGAKDDSDEEEEA